MYLKIKLTMVHEGGKTNYSTYRTYQIQVMSYNKLGKKIIKFNLVF